VTPTKHGNAGRPQESLGPKIARAMIWDYIGYTLLMFLGLALSVVLVRLLGKEQYAVYAYVVNLKAMLILFLSFGFDTAVSRFVPEFKAREEEGAVRHLMGIVVKSRAIALILLAVPLCLLAGPITRFFLDREVFTWYVRLMPLILAPVLFYGPLQNFLVTQYRQRHLNLFFLLASALNLIFSAWLTSSGYGPKAVILVLFFSELLIVAAFYRETKRFLSELPCKERKCINFKRLFSFSFNIYLYSIMIFIMGKGLDIFLLGKFHPDLAQVTYYALAYSFGYFSISALDRVFAGGFMVPLVTELHTRGETEKLHKVFSGSFQFIYIYALPVAVGGVLLADDLIGLLFGRAYSEPVGKLAALTLLYMAVTMYGRISASFLTAMDQEKQLILSRSVFGIVNLGLNLMLIPRYGAVGAVIGTGIAGVLSVIYEARILEKTLKPSYPSGFIFKVLGSSLVMGVTVFFVKKGLGGGWITGTFGPLAAGAACYLFLLIILKPLTGEVTEYLGNINLPGKRFLLSLLG